MFRLKCDNLRFIQKKLQDNYVSRMISLGCNGWQSFILPLDISVWNSIVYTLTHYQTTKYVIDIDGFCAWYQCIKLSDSRNIFNFSIMQFVLMIYPIIMTKIWGLKICHFTHGEYGFQKQLIFHYSNVLTQAYHHAYMYAHEKYMKRFY